MAAKQNVKNAVTKWETEEKKALLYRFLLMKSFLSKTTSSSSLFNPTPSFTSSRTPNSTLLLRRHSQKGNPLLKYIRNVKCFFADIVCDYLLGQNICSLCLSLRYHLLHPDYLYFWIRELQKNYRLRIVLCHVDVEDVVNPLLEVTRTSLLHDCTLLCGWSLEECGRYLETAKVYENKSADLIQGPMDGDYLSRLNHALTAIRHVNKTDVVTLGSTFGSLSHVMDASMEDLACCPDIGERKVKRLYDAFHELFKREVPKRQCIPETSVANESHPGSSSTKEDEKEVGDTSNCEKKDLPSTHTKLPERRINHKKRKKGNVVLMTKLKLEIRMAATRTES